MIIHNQMKYQVVKENTTDKSVIIGMGTNSVDHMILMLIMPMQKDKLVLGISFMIEGEEGKEQIKLRC